MDYNINFSKLKGLSRVKKYLRDTVVAQEGQDAELFIVIKGELGVFSNYRKLNEERIATVSAGGFIGEGAVFLERVPNYTLVALTDTFALHVDRGSMIDFVREEPDFAFELMKALTIRQDYINIAYEGLIGRPWIDAGETTAESTAGKQPAAVAPLFPPEHVHRDLALKNVDNEHLSDFTFACPICKSNFRSMKLLNSKLILDRTDRDMRNRYKGIEPLYYEVISCPNCLYSALREQFNQPEIHDPELVEELQALKSEVKIMPGTARDAATVYAGYYLALRCAAKSFWKPHLTIAKLLHKLCRVYEDSGDKTMEMSTARRALDAYLEVYLNQDLPKTLDPQICLIIGELYLKLGDLKNAKAYFFKVKSQRDAPPALRNHADNRLMDIREMEGKT